MFHWLKRRLFAWVENRQRREIARLKREAMLLKDEVERTTGKPLQWTPEERRLLSEKATGIDPDTLKQISIIDPADPAERNHQTDSTETR